MVVDLLAGPRVIFWVAAVMIFVLDRPTLFSREAGGVCRFGRDVFKWCGQAKHWLAKIIADVQTSRPASAPNRRGVHAFSCRESSFSSVERAPGGGSGGSITAWNCGVPSVF